MPFVTEYTFVYPNDELAVLTEGQRKSLTRIADEYRLCRVITVTPMKLTFDGYVFIRTRGMVIVLKPDGSSLCGV